MAAPHVFTASGKAIQFAGYLRAYVEGSDDPASELGDQEILLPKLAVGDQRDRARARVRSRSAASTRKRTRRCRRRATPTPRS